MKLCPICNQPMYAQIINHKVYYICDRHKEEKVVVDKEGKQTDVNV